MENGKIAVAKKLLNGIGFGSTEFHVLRAAKPELTSLLFYFLLQESVRREARKGMTGSAGQLRVPARFLEELEFPLPPLAEQHQIVSEVERRLSAADEVEGTIEAGLKQAERLRQSILKRAFEGRLVPQDPADPPASELLEKIKNEREKRENKAKKTGKKYAISRRFAGMTNRPAPYFKEFTFLII